DVMVRRVERANEVRRQPVLALVAREGFERTRRDHAAEVPEDGADHRWRLGPLSCFTTTPSLASDPGLPSGVAFVRLTQSIPLRPCECVHVSTSVAHARPCESIWTSRKSNISPQRALIGSPHGPPLIGSDGGLRVADTNSGLDESAFVDSAM